MKKHILSISPNPVIESVVELRFKSHLPNNAVFGVIYNPLINKYKNVISLPIMQLPEDIRLKDPQFKHKAWYRLEGGPITVEIGPEVIVFNQNSTIKEDYIHWSEYSEIIFKILDLIEKTSAIKNISRVGIRYISFFELNIFEKVKVNLSIIGKNIIDKNTQLITEVEEGKFIKRIRLQNHAVLTEGKESKNGSLIDIDAFYADSVENFQNLKDIISEGHLEHKGLFFELLDDEFLDSLNPVYDKGKQ